jgi:hypothetical protein
LSSFVGALTKWMANTSLIRKMQDRTPSELHSALVGENY